MKLEKEKKHVPYSISQYMIEYCFMLLTLGLHVHLLEALVSLKLVLISVDLHYCSAVRYVSLN